MAITNANIFKSLSNHCNLFFSLSNWHDKWLLRTKCMVQALDICASYTSWYWHCNNACK